MKVDAQKAARQAVAVAAKQIARLAEKEALTGWDGADLERYAGICVRWDNHELSWLAKMDPTKCNDELLQRAIREMEKEEGEADGKAQRRIGKGTTTA